LLLENESISRRYVNVYAEGLGVTLKPFIELASFDLLVRFARINLGLAFVIKEFTKEEIDNDNLFEIPLYPEIPPRHVGLVTLKGVRLSKAAKHFVDLVMDS
jgi:DNA-binding transcriptional LysR family regulator